MNEQNSLPFVQAFREYIQQQIYPLHTPGHKGGRVAANMFVELSEKYLWAGDVSLMGELDHLRAPSTCIAAAQELAAELYGADVTHFAVNGTSGALQALVLGTFNPGDKVIVGRNAHCSLLAALTLADLQPIFIQPDINWEFGIHVQVSAESVREAFKQHSDAKGVLLTSPTYFGIVADIEAISKITREHQALLLVDEAHGAHFGFSGKFPSGSLTLGAHGVVQSTHKTLSSFTQTSMLHMKRGLLNCQRVSGMFSMLTTTSPNQWLIGSLDAARYLMATQGEALMERAYALAHDFREQLAAIPDLEIFTLPGSFQSGSVRQDITKVVVNVHKLGYSGIKAGEYLCSHGFSPELTDEHNILFLISYAEDPAKLQEIVELLRALPKGQPREIIAPATFLPERGMSLQTAFYAQREPVPWTQAVGRISGESIIFYPPGIAQLLPGEIIKKEHLLHWRSLVKWGVKLTGCSDLTLETLQVVKQ